VGDSGVGKTSIMMRYTQNEFQEEYMSTVGIDFKIKKIET
jgi:GTPase SAR1 family protein